jgi:adenylate cyclase
MEGKKEKIIIQDTTTRDGGSVRKVLLMGIFWRILIIEGILLVGSIAYRIMTDHHAEPVDLFWYAVRVTLLIGIIIGFIMITFRRFLNRKFIMPLEAISASNRQLKISDSTEVNLVIPDDTPREIQEIVMTRADLLSTIYKVSEERLRLNNFIREMFGRYLSKKIVDNILESPEGHKIGGRRTTVTILLSDIRGFTGLSETMDPEKMVRLLNRYLESMTGIILQYDGIIDEIVGDSIMAVFGVPENRDTDAERAVACALSMQNALGDLNKEFTTEGYPPIEMGIGINTGNVIVGNIGSEMRMKYGVVGSAVNVASRIESNTVGGQVIIGESTYQLVKDLVTSEAPQSFMMKGLKTPLVIYSVTAMGPPYTLALCHRPEKGAGVPMQIAFRCWKIEDKKVASMTMTGETVRLHANIITASQLPPIEPLTDIKLAFDFCVEAHCFEDIYAKVIAVEVGAENSVVQFQITAIHPKDKSILDRWIREAS